MNLALLKIKSGLADNELMDAVLFYCDDEPGTIVPLDEAFREASNACFARFGDDVHDDDIFRELHEQWGWKLYDNVQIFESTW